jgi:DNA-binding transcriptional regulator YiaG
MNKKNHRQKKTAASSGKGRISSKTGVKFKASIMAGAGGASTFSVKEFCGRFQIVRPDLTRLTGYSQRAVDQWAAGDKPSSAAQKQLKEVVRLFDGLADIMESNSIGEWLKTPNEAFDGSSPLQVIERGESDRIWRMIYQLQTGEPI